MLGRPAREHEQQIREPVHVAQRAVTDRLATTQPHDVALGATTDGARLMEEGGDRTAARQDERLQRLEVLLALVDRPLEDLHLLVADADHAVPLGIRRRGELAAEVEELVLHLAENRVEARGDRRFRRRVVERAHDAEDRVQLVDGAVALDPRVVLGDTLAADEMRLALVAGPCVDLVDADRHVRNSPGPSRRGGRRRASRG